MSRYTSTTDADRAAMLELIGAGSIDDLFSDVPSALRLQRPLALPPGRSEQEVYTYLRELAAANVSCDEQTSFLGAGMYDHYVPALVDSIVSRSEFLTPYTPYQPEVSQGGLQAMFEYQTMISELTGLPVSNASVYDGASAVAAAAYMAHLKNRRTRLVVSRAVHPHAREALRTASAGWRATVVEVPVSEGATEADALSAAVDESTCAVILQQPNFLGAVEDIGELAAAVEHAGATLIVSCDPLSLGILEPPGALGADVCVGEGQSLGNALAFGGPSFGFLAATDQYLRQMPGRIAGETRDIEGRRGFVLTLQTREQHIRREKATSNICTSQALNALAATIYLSWLGARGVVEIAELMLRRTAYARERLSAIDGVSQLHEQPVVREFAVRLDAPARRVVKRCVLAGVMPGYVLAPDYPEYPDCLLVALTEQRTRADIDRLVEVLDDAIATERSRSRSRVPA